MLLVKNIYKSYFLDKLELPILKNINFEIKLGEFVAITGPSGSGKTTLLSLLAGFDKPSKGEIYFEGKNLTNLKEDELAQFRLKNVGFIFQNYELISSLTALENVSLPLQIRGDREAVEKAKKLLLTIGLKDRMHHYPAQLSGGESQRVAIARAVINEPKLLLADEPTGNLDSTNGKAVLDLLLAHLNSRALILVTHNPLIAKLSHRELQLKDGQIVRQIKHRIKHFR